HAPSYSLFPYTTLFRSLEFVTANDSTSPNPAGFRVKLTGTAQSIPPRNTQINPLPLVIYFRAAFTFQANPAGTSLKLRALIDDRSEEHTSELQSPDHLV